MIATDETQTEKETDWKNGSKVDATGHLDCLPSIEKSRSPGEDLGHECRKNHMPAGNGQKVPNQSDRTQRPTMLLE